MNRVAVALMAVIISTSVQAGGADYFVVLGSYPQNLQDEAAHNAVRVVKAANRCGYKPLVGSSDRMIGMRSGYFIQVLGAFEEDTANLVKADVRRCVPDAYIKRGVYVPRARKKSPAYAPLDEED